MRVWLEITSASHVDLETERAARRLNHAHLVHDPGIADIADDRQSAKTWQHLAQEPDSFGSKVIRLGRQASDITARSCQARNQAATNRVRRYWEHDRDLRGCLFCRWDSGSARDNDIDLHPDKLGCQLGKAFAASLGPAIFNRDGAAFDPAELAQPLHKSGDPIAPSRKRTRAQEPDGRELGGLLRVRRERPRGCCAAEQRDEVAPPHVGHGLPPFPVCAGVTGWKIIPPLRPGMIFGRTRVTAGASGFFF
jgi:hypothetical protein